MNQILLASTEHIAGYRVVEHLGIVRGTSIRTRHVFHDFVEWLRNVVGAELDHYVKMLAEAREQALDRLREDARRVGANAVVGLRVEMSRIARGAAEIFVYGTAVRVVPDGA
ncbi:MAG: YbjQ family protein [Planctomycetota bacterium]